MQSVSGYWYIYIIHLGKGECHNIHAECGYGVFKKVFFSFYKMLISLLLILGNLLAFRDRNHLYIRAATWDFQQCGMCAQQKLRPACADAQSDQSFC